MRIFPVKNSILSGAAVSVIMLAVSLPAVAAKFDGSAPLVCEIAAIHECAPGALCQVRTVESVNFAPRMRVDVGGKRVHNLAEGKGTNRESLIQAAAHQNGKLIVSGAEFARGWVLVIHEDTGRLSGTASGDGDGFVMFGQCVTQ